MFPYVRNLTTITSVHSADIGMSTYSKGPTMSYINSTPGNMETNQDIINNGVNRTSVDNRRASSSSRHQATGHNGRSRNGTTGSL